MFRFTSSSTKWIVCAGYTASLLHTDCQSKATDDKEPSKHQKIEKNPHASWDKDWDMRKHKQNKNKVVHQIIMVRHGQYNTESEDDAERHLTAVGRQQAETTGKRLNTLLSCGQLAPVKTVYFSTMTRATETCQLILPQITESATVPTLASTATTVGVGSTGIPLNGAEPGQNKQKAMRVEACSMIREGAVCRPSPSSSGWDPSEECFEKEGARVRHEVPFSCYYLFIISTFQLFIYNKLSFPLLGPSCFQESRPSRCGGRREQLQHDTCLPR
jgi:Histidine phosphatase superfamily (branch 1)